jgi:hypothetical protein
MAWKGPQVPVFNPTATAPASTLKVAQNAQKSRYGFATFPRTLPDEILLLERVVVLRKEFDS